jgi:DNA-binding transcriptional MerR regulator
MKNEWTKKQAAEALRITPRTIHYYTDEGLITPEIANPKGKGTTRKYSAKNLLEILVIRELVKLGLNLSRIKQAMNAVKSGSMGLLGHSEFWNSKAKEGSLIPQPGMFLNPAEAGVYLIGYDVHTDHGWFAAFVTKGKNDPIDLWMTNLDHHLRCTTAVVIDVTSARDKVRKLL